MVNRRERYRFLSTPSARRATRQIFHRAVGELISIHALREEGDLTAFNAGALHFNFYPRPPRGGRPAVRTKKSLPRRHFYPRPPRGGRHADLENPTQAPMMSIHALREEGDHGDAC